MQNEPIGGGFDPLRYNVPQTERKPRRQRVLMVYDNTNNTNNTGIFDNTDNIIWLSAL